MNKTNLSLLIPITALYFYGDTVLFSLAYLAVFLFVSFRALQSAGRKRTRVLLMIAYLVVLITQAVFYAQVVAGHDFWREHPLRKLFAVAVLLLPGIISRYVTVGKYAELYLPTLREASTISFAQLREYAGLVTRTVAATGRAGRSLTPDNFKVVIGELPRHDSFRYVNAGSLTADWFRAAEASLHDPHLYIVISDTGTPAGEILSVFTQKQFNHASLAFDAELSTIVSYNGGERLYPPGLNREMIAYFNKKPSASILVYRLTVTAEQKRAALDKILRINREGSAYNMLGLLTARSYKPNIMYCSQFVYNLLKHIGAAHFEAAGVIKPTDLIEKDYFRKLEFVEELRLNRPGGLLTPPSP